MLILRADCSAPAEESEYQQSEGALKARHFEFLCISLPFKLAWSVTHDSILTDHCTPRSERRITQQLSENAPDPGHGTYHISRPPPSMTTGLGPGGKRKFP